MPDIPAFIPVTFILTTLIALYIFYKASGSNKMVLTLLLGWLILQAIIGLSGFYQMTEGIPPRGFLLVVPPLLLVVYLMTSKSGKRFTDSLDQELITWIHTIRIPIELVIYWLYLEKLMPQIMTFEGRNFDILVGLTAPVVAWLVFFRNRFGNNLIAYWNVFGILLLLNVVVHAFLSAPFDFQQLSFEQPNVAVFYFPFIYLPGFLVPLVLYCHLASLRRALTKRKII